jgi:hypothetical protein
MGRAMNSLRISAWLGLALSAIGGVLKVVRVMRQAEWWPFIAYDYIAALLLVVGAWAVLRRGGDGRWLAAGWGFGVAMTYGSFFDHLQAWMTKAGPDLDFQRTMSTSVGILLAVNLLGLALALWPPAVARAGVAAVAAR